ncbi:hypothetical protein PFICI_03674 [Pestalotiopsis fici W106-1]|uniref:tripeptidyl-peptidase II n=1 Tax=Pestalotiopsis fici (strain W106-1 / CGMCC3.15140) TaxID=1229662 RepID=W3XI18_PESFW|nr:uncharacterized protein PFICI_03674 [Pestalotiopsis fici W106-1]ETS85649.1 hypothetical protein PFICI_03674 [Pestalotiopsis fici W106-1]
MSITFRSLDSGIDVTLLTAPPADHMITLSIGLTMNNMDELDERLKAVSTPGSPLYGKYLDKHDIESLFFPSTDAYKNVTSWLRSNGVEKISQQGSSINFATTVANANKLLNTEFAYYDIEGVKKLRTRQYDVPDEVADHINLIHPTTYFGKSRSMMNTRELVQVSQRETTPSYSNTTTNCSTLLQPYCFRDAYGVEDYTPDENSGSRVAFGSFLNNSARLEDFHLYQNAYGIPESNFSTEIINGGLDHQDINGKIGEANLDSQLQSAMTYPLPQIQYITGGKPPFVPSVITPDEESNTNEPWLDFYEFLINKTNDQLPQVISNSYGEDEQTVPPEYARRVCNLIGVLGLRGISVLQSSGDGGVGVPCISNDGKNHTEFSPQFPASCPYVTSVGGTQSWAPEIGWSGSSGGFSNYFAQPWYQTGAVNTYLDSGINLEAKEYYEAGAYANFSGRAFPDISAHSYHPNYAFYIADAAEEGAGTSAAAPVAAGVIALLNDARLRAGKPTMGFLNPFLYSLEMGPLIDVTSGTSTGCTGTTARTGKEIPGAGVIPNATWNSTIGWDPVTGLGLPYFKEMVKVAMMIV